ncbi:MAG: hypothetical protein IJ087_10035 [Eggerthellaceae bacterium]|nr:hypothetical protein [Eggerthellaceae bacterium]
MAYKNLGTFLTKVTLKAIEKLDEADVDEHMRIAENVTAWVAAKKVAPNHAQMIFDAIHWTGPIPEPEPEHTSEGLTLQDVSDGLADLGEVVSEIIVGMEG